MVALWTDIVNPAELTAFSRVALEAMDDSLLTAILPNVLQDEVKFSWKIGEAVGGEAEYGEFDAEAPIGDTGGGEEKTVRLLPVSRKLKLSEYEQVTEPARVSQLAEDRADALVKQIINRLNRARAMALVTGKLTLNENGIKQVADFGRKAAHTNAAPTALFSAAGADPIADIRRFADMVADAVGAEVDTIAGSTRIATAIGGKLAAAGYVTGGGNVVSRGVVNEILADHGLPQFTVYDGRTGGTRFIADDQLIVAVGGGFAGGTVFAPTVESGDPRFNLGSGERSGIVAGLYKGEDPPIGWVLAKAIALPILANPNATLAAKVL